jgi:DNA repair exonuclease SbcCD ATPase subunit
MISISALTAVITALYPAVKFLSAYDRRIAILEEQQMTLSKKHDKTEHELHAIQRDINKICVTLERIETNIEHLKDKKIES